MSHKAAKAARVAARKVGKAAAQRNRQRLYQLCLARCDGNLMQAANLFQTTSAAFPEMTPEVQEQLLAAMESSLQSIRAIKEQAAEAARAAEAPVPQVVA